MKDTLNIDFTNPCSKGLIKKLYKQPRHTPPELLDKEIVDEIIYRAQGRERMMLELMGRTAMRVGEVMSIRPQDLNIDVSTIAIEQPKSGRYGEVVYLPQRMMRRMDDYIREHGIGANDRIFPISYTVKETSTSPDKKGFDTGVRLSLCNDKFKIDLEKEFSGTTLKRLIATLETI